MGQKHSSSQAKSDDQEFQEFNAVEYGKQTAIVLLEDARFLCAAEGTPFDLHQVTGGLKFRTECSLYNFKHNFHRTYVPVSLLATSVHESENMEDKDKVCASCSGSAIAFSPSCSADLEGYLFFASGPCLTEMTVGVLTSAVSDNSYSSEGTDACEPCPLKVSCVETVALPGRTRQILSNSGRCPISVCVRCDYHLVFFEVDDDKSTDELTNTSQETAVELLDPVAVYQTSSLTSCACLSPFIPGEAVFMTVTGGVYQWESGEGVTTLQSPLHSPDVTDTAHFWRCLYGPHPRSVIIAEHKQVSILDFRSAPLYTSVLIQGSPHFPITAVVTALSAHPLNPFHLFVVTTFHVLLLDLRQSEEPLLMVSHEMYDPPLFLGVCQSSQQSEEVSLLLSSFHHALSHAFCISGGVSLRSLDIKPPHLTTMPHCVTSYHDFYSQLKLKALSLQDRLKQPLAGIYLISLKNGHWAAILLSSLGDVFYQVWHYESSPPDVPAVPAPPAHSCLWVEQAHQQEKALATSLSDQSKTKEMVVLVKDFKCLQTYVTSGLADQGLCLRCLSLLSKGGCYDDIPMTASQLSEWTPPILDGLGGNWSCSFCQEDGPVVIRQERHVHKTGMQLLREVVLGDGGEAEDRDSCPSQFDEVRRLWNKWEDLEQSNSCEGEAADPTDTHDFSPTPSLSVAPKTKKVKSHRSGF